MANFLAAALDYARAGYSVLPVRGKIPLTEHGAHDATTDEARIRAWWKRWPKANVAITLAGLVVIDIDPRNGGDLAALPPMPDTCRATTGNGLHFLFRSDKTYRGKHAPGVDIKSGRGAYIVVAPSVHANGKHYAWITSPLANEPAAAPAWLVQSQRAPSLPAEVNPWAKIRPLVSTRLYPGLDDAMIQTFHGPATS